MRAKWLGQSHTPSVHKLYSGNLAIRPFSWFQVQTRVFALLCTLNLAFVSNRFVCNWDQCAVQRGGSAYCCICEVGYGGDSCDKPAIRQRIETDRGECVLIGDSEGDTSSYNERKSFD